ncbi:MAG: HlyD family efflux transporter periplasmic adaptor subunit [Clostridia bacterium]|nr:HlyD family efflux transporter periplasmic adaptor subunit [Clostridia bacterium]MBQ7897764.1 HlyD family efflux transporter periplasmic adaptor subunit [Clostridia bacterium]
MKTRKDLIKNIAIIFLAVMLVLTFFSNTILNWSLPQVSGRYTEYGEIKTGVRGSGQVVSNLTYTETVKGDRKIEEVYVSRGSVVEAGQTLMLLGPTDSEKAESLEAEIATLEDAYNRALLSKTEYDYEDDEYQIKIATEDLNIIKAERAVYTDEYIAGIKKNAEDKEKAYEAESERLESLEEELEELSENSSDPEIVEAREKVAKAQERVDIAKEALEKAEKALSEVNKTDTGSLNSQLDSLYDSYDRAKTELSYLKEDNAHLIKIRDDKKSAETALNKAKTDYDKAVTDYGEDSAEALTAKETLDSAQTAFDEAEKLYNENAEEIKTAERAIAAQVTEVDNISYEIYSVRAEISSANKENKAYNDYKNTVSIKEKALESEEADLEVLEKALEELVKTANKELTASIKTSKKALEDLGEEKAEAEEKLAELDTVKTLDAEIKSGERSLEQLVRALEKKKEADKKAAELENFDRNKEYAEIQKKKAELAEIKGGSKEGYELKASRSGTVTEVNFRPGEVATDGAAALTVEVVESGYTLSFSVSVNEASRLKEGDTATVSDTYWGQSVGAVLTKITPDQGGKTKTLTFELSGNVNAGQTLTLTVGERTTGYSAVIPKNALHEDSEGKFIYITKTKSTPLGDRFVATRLPVTVAASDDKNVAIATDEAYLYEYVITSSTKPFEEGGYVRLSD